MSWSIHLEGGKHVVRMTARSTAQMEEGTGSEGAKVSSHTTRQAAANKIRELGAAERKEVAMAAARDLLGV